MSICFDTIDLNDGFHSDNLLNNELSAAEYIGLWAQCIATDDDEHHQY